MRAWGAVSDEGLSEVQRRVARHPLDGGALYVHGLPGTGKSAALAARLGALLAAGCKPHEIMVLVPQRAHAERYEQTLAALDGPLRGGVEVVTPAGLARRTVALFWPLAGTAAGFHHPQREPTFLTIESAQYYLWRLVEPLISREGYFRDLTIRRGRLLSQLIDNLNKAALVGFDHREILPRLRGAWTGTPERLHAYEQAQDCARRFRAYCLEHTLLDFSLLIEVFARHLLALPAFRGYLQARYRHLLADNVEENPPVAHRLIEVLLGGCDSAVLAVDDAGGHRVFLGADREGAAALAQRCQSTLRLDEPPAATGWGRAWANGLALADAMREVLGLPGVGPGGGRAAAAICGQGGGRYWVEMLSRVADEAAALVSRGVAAEQIAVLSPYVSEVMRFALEELLRARGVALHLLRPAAMMRDDPVVRGLLVLALLAHPQWEVWVRGQPLMLEAGDVALALEVALGDADPVRARQLARAAWRDEGRLERVGAPGGRLAPVWEQVGYTLRERYMRLYDWLEGYRREPPQPLDVMLSRLFGELLSTPGFGCWRDVARGRACGRLVESAAKFREAARVDPQLTDDDVGREFVQHLLGEVASAEYLVDWPPPPASAVVLAPAHAYLTRDMRSQYQFWIELGAEGWWSRPNQPLTQPYVLARGWTVGAAWTDDDEERAKRDTLARVVTGLAARCTRGIYLAYSELGMGGEDQIGGRLQRLMVTALSKAARDER